MDLQEFLEIFNADESDIIEYSSEQEALEAVKRNGDALRHVKEQTEAVCLEAVKATRQKKCVCENRKR